ncbi:acetyl-CoA carboxylase carboxyl transferase subunit alpha [Sphaerisporangium siamense]|uniref:Multifunctional fusion protein n=1 Tax=Sphaerisporangium siamense TaxID=795645 RepID=A0A7W7DBV4_9ACTN|nr:acetyl-CoA carboxylase carboxyl transferase subunit alpha [Sphaerisporangium siamense]MBB4703964.1 acetyl-CoA carboxylase carboxyl transferase subunit beta [Sphaerisporangium siamense]
MIAPGPLAPPARKAAEPSPQEERPLWVRCPGCAAPVYGEHFRRDLRVCPTCAHHDRLGAAERLDHLVDPGSFTPLAAAPTLGDPLGFTDTRPYPLRLEQARSATGLEEAVVCGRAAIGGHRAVVAVMDFAFMGGSLGCAVGERVTAAAEHALAAGVPLVLVTASGGARMQEGALALMQMAKTSQALGDLDEAGLLTVSVVTDPTYGGVAASYATLADVILAEAGAHMGFAGPRVIAGTLGQTLPEGFQTAETLLAGGLVDGVVRRAELRAALARLLAAASWTRRGRPVPQAWAEAPPLVTDPGDLPGEERPEAWAAVALARDPGRPTTLDYAAHLLEDFCELRGDRASGDCPAIVAGVGRLDQVPVMLIGHQKGHDTRELVARNFGMGTPAGFRKAARAMLLAGKLGLPVVTLIDTPGAYAGVEAEAGGQAHAIAASLRLMSHLPVPVVTVVTGEGGSGGALALGVADRVLALSNAVYSVISPEGCAAILWRDPSAAPAAADALRLGARDLLRHRILDAVIPEPEGGAHRDPARTAHAVGRAVAAALHDLIPEDSARLVRARKARFRRYGLPA